ncbi:hypothetical protein [Buchananella hordeovulneris]|nr:hypothetical protein [Buchananella hordeovulneris]MDO5080950.1 hypothetical protein [Buchananella hordeovulneris]
MPEQKCDRKIETLTELRPGKLAKQELGSSLTDAIAECSSETEAWQGLAFTTAGARMVVRVEGSTLLSSQTQPIDQATVYELRLWRTGVAQHCATEVRWLNGWGAVRVDVYPAGDTTTQAERTSCLLRENNYLQNGKDAAQMHTVEVFTTDNYGNVNFVDELFCGEWSIK